MPTVPSSNKCRELQCQNQKTQRSAFCSSHGGAQTEQGKANSKLYAQAAWQKIRTRQLSKEPLCGCCLSNGIVRAAEHVDHVFPHRRNPIAFKVNLFQSLCGSCHTLKTHDENKGVYKHYTSRGIIEYTGDDYIRICGA